MTADLKALLQSARTIAVVGLSPKPERDSHRVARYLQAHGYRIVPVRPAVASVLGERAFGKLGDVPEPVDIVNVFRRSEFLLQIVEDAAAVKAGAVWAQLGIESAEASKRAEELGIPLVSDRCIMVDHRRLFPGA